MGFKLTKWGKAYYIITAIALATLMIREREVAYFMCLMLLWQMFSLRKTVHHLNSALHHSSVIIKILEDKANEPDTDNTKSKL